MLDWMLGMGIGRDDCLLCCGIEGYLGLLGLACSWVGASGGEEDSECCGGIKMLES